MKKYKLIQKYPSLANDWEVGMEIGLGDRNYGYSPCSGNYTDCRKLDNAEVENNPQFWQEVIEKDYEILSFKQDSDIIDLWIKFTGGWSRNVKGYPETMPYTLQDILKNDLYKIHSVKRLSDGEVFAIGDKFEANIGRCDVIRTIEKIKIGEGDELLIFHENGYLTNEKNCGIFCEIKKVVEKDYEILIAKTVPYTILSVKRLSDGEVFTVGDKIKTPYTGCTPIVGFKDPEANEYFIEVSSGFTRLSTIEKLKQPIFLTHDGKDIFEGDKVWWVNKKTFNSGYFVSTPSVTFFSDINAYFLTEEAAENYVVQKSPSLSIEDFWEFVCWGGSNVAKSKRLKRLVKERLNLK